MELEITLSSIYWAVNFILPAYATNSIPALFGGGKPLDFEKNFVDGERILGSHKTFRGFISGLIAGAIISALEGLLIHSNLFLFGMIVSIGALSGDLGGAFLKRRLRLPPGYALPLLDQVDFVLGALGFASLLYTIEVGSVFQILLVTPAIHVLANMIAYVSKAKDVFW